MSFSLGLLGPFALALHKQGCISAAIQLLVRRYYLVAQLPALLLKLNPLGKITRWVVLIGVFEVKAHINIYSNQFCIRCLLVSLMVVIGKDRFPSVIETSAKM